MNKSKAIEIMMQLKAEYFYAFKDMPDNLFKIKIDNFMKALEDYSDKEIDIALGMVLKENKTVPTIANFVEVLNRNREVFLPSVEKEWSSVVSALNAMKDNCSEFNNSGWASDEQYSKYFKKQRSAYDTLSDDVKGYYGDYNSFVDLLEITKLEVEKARFIKAFPQFRRDFQIKKKIMSQLDKRGL